LLHLLDFPSRFCSVVEVLRGASTGSAPHIGTHWSMAAGPRQSYEISWGYDARSSLRGDAKHLALRHDRKSFIDD
jgi:hypothetical protein